MPLFHVEFIFSSFPAAGEPLKSQAGYEQEDTVSHHSETAKITSIPVPHPAHLESWKWHTYINTNIPTAIQSPVQSSQNPPCSPTTIYSIAGQLWEQSPGLRHPAHSPGIPNMKVPFPAACESSTAGFHLPLLFSSCYCVTTSPLKSPSDLQGLPSSIPLEEFCSKPLPGCGNFCQNAFSSTLLLFS